LQADVNQSVASFFRYGAPVTIDGQAEGGDFAALGVNRVRDLLISR
jgi:hypothetical protein